MSIDLEVDKDGVATVTINRPEVHNALDSEHYAAISKAWQTVRDDPQIRVAIVTGAGDRAFCAGADIKNVLTQRNAWSDVWLTQKDQLLNRGLEVWKPIIAAVNGFCLGGGVTMLYSTDIRVASEHATFNLAEVKRGIIAGNGGTQRTLQQLPWCIGMEMLLTGDPIDAKTAERWGLINKVVPHKDLMKSAREYAARIAANAPLAVQAAKELAIRSRDTDINTGLRIEQLIGRMLRETEDAKEGPKAFREKRKPNFKGE
ncbi:enoyl-CoA hydratase [Afipia sp. P52-10]|uniref:enoyl-CoA hydratase/isomerase family protein n=1 Tax=Afipia sp. P52-10 TaxID=1429916 RepID=UPI0003DF2229|nr:enoyl-CoA hydratase-related protein [Afipia sp. P52-10]ETR75412.1 enoyl-CoA hydratase [Afipia sp. P52-10]